MPDQKFSKLTYIYNFRIFTFRAKRLQWFLIDFCYFCQLMTWSQTLICGVKKYEYNGICSTWFQVNYVLAHGPVSMAIVPWQDGLIFHSVIKVSTVCIHFLPTIFYFLIRWEFDQSPNLTLWTGLIYPIMAYVVWQAIYLCVQFAYLDHNKTLGTSIR